MTTPDIEYIRRVLLLDWDPIDVHDVKTLDDEYHAYSQQIASLLMAGAPVATISRELIAIETDRMGLVPDRGRAERVAAKLHAHHHRL